MFPQKFGRCVLKDCIERIPAVCLPDMAGARPSIFAFLIVVFGADSPKVCIPGNLPSECGRSQLARRFEGPAVVYFGHLHPSKPSAAKGSCQQAKRALSIVPRAP
eukprot:4887035-Prymnesium_polylepis.1